MTTRRCGEDGYTLHIGKPVNPADLVSTMAQLAALVWRRKQCLEP